VSQIIVETGVVGKLASGAVMVMEGETVRINQHV
jgi:polyribonucleotide nucleotidyltransferase